MNYLAWEVGKLGYYMMGNGKNTLAKTECGSAADKMDHLQEIINKPS